MPRFSSTIEENDMTDKRKPAAPTARTGGLADLEAGDPNELKRDLAKTRLHPQGAGGIDPAEDTGKKERARTKRRLARVLR
jgi:hypothetical protein